MIENKFDLSTLSLSAGTYSIAVKARASGYEDSPSSNAVSYVVAGETVQVSGTWYFNDDLIFYDIYISDVGVNFTSNGKLFDIINAFDGGDGLQYRSNDDVYYTDVWHGDWYDEAYRTITFVGVQTVSREFYEWLMANATRPVSGQWIFNQDIVLVSRDAVVEFISNGIQFKRIDIDNYFVTYTPLVGEKGDQIDAYYYKDGWSDSVYRTIEFLDTQYVSQKFYEWFIEMAVRSST